MRPETSFCDGASDNDDNDNVIIWRINLESIRIIIIIIRKIIIRRIIIVIIIYRIIAMMLKLRLFHWDTTY